MKSWVPRASDELRGENLCTSTCRGVQSPAVTGGFGSDSSGYFMHYNYKGIGEAALGTHKDKVNGDNQLFQLARGTFAEVVMPLCWGITARGSMTGSCSCCCNLRFLFTSHLLLGSETMESKVRSAGTSFRPSQIIREGLLQSLRSRVPIRELTARRHRSFEICPIQGQRRLIKYVPALSFTSRGAFSRWLGCRSGWWSGLSSSLGTCA